MMDEHVLSELAVDERARRLQILNKLRKAIVLATPLMLRVVNTKQVVRAILQRGLVGGRGPACLNDFLAASSPIRCAGPDARPPTFTNLAAA